MTIVLLFTAILLFFAPSWEAMLVLLLFYLYGSIPYATIVSRRLVGKKIEHEGSGSVGVANSYMNAGMMAGTLTVVGEISKGLLPLFISFQFFDYSVLCSVLFLGASLLGTNFSIFNRLLGGMGTTMVLWSLLIISPFSLVGFLLVILVSYFLTKDTFWMTAITYASGPVVIYFVDGRWPMVGLGLFVAAVYLLKFRRSMDEFELSKQLKG